MQITDFTISKSHFTWDELLDMSITVKMGAAEQVAANQKSRMHIFWSPCNDFDAVTTVPPQQSAAVAVPRNALRIEDATPHYPDALNMEANDGGFAIARNGTKVFSESGFSLSQFKTLEADGTEIRVEPEYEGLTNWDAVIKHMQDSGYTGDDRTCPMGLTVVVADSYGGYSTGRMYSASKASAATLLMARLDPVINGITFEDTHPANPYGKFGGYVAGQSKPKITADVTLDPLDPTLTAKHKIEVIRYKQKIGESGRVEYVDNETIASAEADLSTPLEPVLPDKVLTYIPEPEIAQGYDPKYIYMWRYTVTDSAGNMSGTGRVIDIWNYTLPTLVTTLGTPAVQRYIEKVEEDGTVVYVPAAIGERVWLNLGMDVSAVGDAGRNGWELRVTYGIAGNDSSMTKTITEGVDNDLPEWVQDRTIFDDAFSAAYRYSFTFTLTDSLQNKAVLIVFIDPAEAVFAGNSYGLGIGMRAQATADDPKRVDVAPGWRFLFHNDAGAVFEFPPIVTAEDNGKALVVVDGVLQLAKVSGGSSGISPVTAMKSVAQQQYQNNTEVEAVDLPGATTLGTYAFQNCTNLKTVNLPLVATIPAYCFGGCTALETVDLGAATSLAGSAFVNCSSMTALILRASTRAAALASTFTGSAIAAKTCKIYVPKSLVTSYQGASVWSTYKDQILAIEDYPEITGG